MSSDLGRAQLLSIRSCAMTARKLQSVEPEAAKGCRRDVSPYPVDLEPPYTPVHLWGLQGHTIAETVPSLPVLSPDVQMVRHDIWASAEQATDWNRNEMFIRCASGRGARVGLEILGNRDAVTLRLLCEPRHVQILKAAFCGQFETSEITPVRDDPLAAFPLDSWAESVFLDYYPWPPYCDLLTLHEEIRRSPLATTLLAALCDIAPPGMGLYQVLFQGVHPLHNWSANVQSLIDRYYDANTPPTPIYGNRFAAQAPSNHLQQTAMDVTAKAFRPLFATAIRILVIGSGPQGAGHLAAMSSAMNAFTHGGRPLNLVSHADYRAVLSPQAIRAMFLSGVVYRSGFVLNSLELAGVAHIIAPGVLETHDNFKHLLKTTKPPEELLQGTPLGTTSFAGVDYPICIPLRQLGRHVQMVGKTDLGKSTLLMRMILDRIQQGESVIVLDPHGDLVNDVLLHIPAEAVPRTIVCDMSNDLHIPKFNPFARIPCQDLGRTAIDFVSALKAVSKDWGDRLDRILLFCLLGILLLGGTLMDVYDLINSKTARSRALRDAILERLDDNIARTFWLQEFETLKDELSAPKNKVHRLLLGSTVGLMLSQPDSAIDLRKIMDQGMVFLVNFSGIAEEVCSVLGSLMLILIRQNALSRAHLPKHQRHPVRVFVDESACFLAGCGIAELISQTRKYGVSLNLACQYIDQVRGSQQRALGTVGTTIVFEVDAPDAAQLAHRLQGKVEPSELTCLTTGEAVARIGGHVVRLNTYGPLDPPQISWRDTIIERSRQLYCRSANEIRALLAERRDGSTGLPNSVSSATSRSGPSTASGETSEPGTEQYSTF